MIEKIDFFGLTIYTLNQNSLLKYLEF